MKIQPLGDRVLVRRSKAEEKSPGGVMLPDNAKKKPVTGEVLAVGPDVGHGGALVKPAHDRPGPGDVVLFARYAGLELDDPDMDGLVLLKEEEILALVEK